MAYLGARSTSPLHVLAGGPRPTVNTRVSDTTISRVVHGLRSAMTSMQAESQAALVLEHESAQTVRYLFNQVAALQRGFTGLADAVLEELDALHEREERWQRERASVASLAAEVRRKLAASISPAEAAELRDRLSQLETRLASAVAVAEGARAEARHAASAAAEGRRAGDAAAARLDALQAQAAQADTLLADELARVSKSSSDASAALASELTATRADLAAVHGWALEVEAAHGARLAAAEAALAAAAAAREEAAAGAAAAAASVDALAGRLAGLAAQQAAHARHAEAVLHELEDGASAAVEGAARAERRAVAAATVAEETHDALCRATAVFADALRIPCPVVSSPGVASALASLRAVSPAPRGRSPSPLRGGGF